MLLPRFTYVMFEGSMFSFLWPCRPGVLPLLDAPRLQIPFSIYFFCAIPELILLMILLTPPPLYMLEDYEGIPEPDLLVLSLLDF